MKKHTKAAHEDETQERTLNFDCIKGIVWPFGTIIILSKSFHT
jgi:hypothetical protein